MSESIVILMISVSTFLGLIGLLALIWAVKTGQFDDESKFIDAVKHDNVEDLRDAVQMSEKKKQYQAEKRYKEKNYMPPD